jgi:hypothetical protein
MFDETTIAAVGKIAARLNVPVAALLAVVEVESGGCAFARFGDRTEPLIRFEGHYFDRLLNKPDRVQARRNRLASPKVGGVKNPRSQVARWALLTRAARINRAAAYASVSWGVGQVMGENWRALGYKSVEALVAEARSGLEGQVEVMARFISANDLNAHLRTGDWAAFARRYNGPAYRRNRYDTRMKSAFTRWNERLNGGLPKFVGGERDEIGFGARGEMVRVLQERLREHGHFLRLDGIFGLKTDRALRAFQDRHGLEETGRFSSGEAVRLGLPNPEAKLRWLPALGQALGQLFSAVWTHMKGREALSRRGKSS